MTSLDRPPDIFEEPLMVAHAMFRKGKREEACRFLARKRDEAVSSGALNEAALYASVRGSYLVAMGKNSEALVAYLEAEQFGGGEAGSVLRTARHLLNGMKQPDQALERANAVLELEACSHAMKLSAHGIRGVALLALDQPEKASEELKTIFLGSDQVAARSCNLVLVRALAEKQLVPELCQRYLDLVETKARGEGEDRVLSDVLEIKAILE